MTTRRAIFMSKVRDNSAPKIILGVCWGARAIARHSSPSLIFRIQLNISDGIFLRKELTSFIPQLFSQIKFIIDVRLGSKYASDYG